MGYIDNNLMPDEQVIYRTHLHPVVYAGAISLAIASVPVAVMLSWKYAGGMLFGAALWYGWCKVIVNTSEFAVTTKRVLIKTGFVARNAWEMHLSRIEGVQIDQDLFGRLLDYGTVIVKGVGGSSDPFKNISQPLALRRAVVESMGGTVGEGKAGERKMMAYQEKQMGGPFSKATDLAGRNGDGNRDRDKKTDPQSMAWTQTRSDAGHDHRAHRDSSDSLGPDRLAWAIERWRADNEKQLQRAGTTQNDVELGQNLSSPSQNINQGCGASTAVADMPEIVRTLNMLVEEYRRLRGDLDELRGLLLDMKKDEHRPMTQQVIFRQEETEQAIPMQQSRADQEDKATAGGRGADTDTRTVQFHKWEVPGRDERGVLIDKT